MKKSIISAAFAAVAISLLTGCGNSSEVRKIKIGVSVPSATHGWTGGIIYFAQKAEKEIEAANPDVDVIISTGPTTTDQANSIDNFIARKVDAIVVVSQEPGPLTPPCAAAKAAGIYLVVVSNPLSEPVHDVFVNGDNRSLGEEAANAIGTFLNGKGNILVMEGIPNPINTDRVTGFNETLAEKYPEIKIMESQPAWWNTEKGMNLMETYLLKYPQIDALWAGDDDVLVGALQAYENSKRSDIKVIVGGGGSKLVVGKVLHDDPVVKATVTYSPRMAEVGVYKALEGLRNGGKPLNDEKEVLIRSEIVTKENAAEHYFPDSAY